MRASDRSWEKRGEMLYKEFSCASTLSILLCSFPGLSTATADALMSRCFKNCIIWSPIISHFSDREAGRKVS